MAKQEKAAPARSLADLQRSINKDYGDGTVMLGQDSIVAVDVFPTYIASIDKALGCGGLPQGRIIEIFGLESSGKTTTCLQFIAACQRHYFPNKERSGVAAFIDVEHAFDRDWAEKCGVDTNHLLFSQPNDGEEAFEIIKRMVESGLVDLIVVDSVAALTPKSELDGEISDTSIGAQARLMSKGLRMIRGIVNTSKTSVVFINQIRQKIGVMFGNPETTPGGLALKFYASIRAQISKGSAIKVGKEENVVGFRPTMKIIKNKVAPPFTKAEFDLCVGHPDRPVYGIDAVGSLIEVAVAYNIMEKSGSHYVYGSERLGNGIAATSATVRGNEKLQEELRKKIYGVFLSKEPVLDSTNGDQPTDL